MRNTILTKLTLFLLSLACAVAFLPSQAQSQEERFSAAGYFRVSARPDFQGGWSQLGLWNISGRLLNESQWAALELRLKLVEATPGSKEAWTSVHAKIEGGSTHAADLARGNLGRFYLTQLYALAGNILFEDVVWQLGTLDFYYGDLGLYDFKLAQIFYDTVGLSATWRQPKFDLLVGLGDSGYLKKAEGYHSVLTLGAALRVRPIDGLEFGLGGEVFYEPEMRGNEYSPHQTKFVAADQIGYENYLRNNIVATLARHYGQQYFASHLPKPTPSSAFSFKAVGYLGFGKLGPLIWNNLYLNFLREHPKSYIKENYQGQTYRLFVSEWTDERYQFNVGNEMQLALVENVFDLTWAALFSYQWDKDDKISASERNRLYWSVVARGQVYMSSMVHLLLETSFAHEKSLQGRLFRSSARSITQNIGGVPNKLGLEMGDLDARNTWQGKVGLVLNPGGSGIFARPSLRLLYGVQYSNVHDAFPNSNSSLIDSKNEFFGQDVLKQMHDRHWHHVLSIEAEAWF